METVKVDLGERSYEISIGSHILSDLGERLRACGLNSRIAMVSNPTVFPLYGEMVSESIRRAGYDLITIIIPDGEEYKELAQIERIYDELLGNRLDRSSALIALGGGVIGDMAGFAASTYMRGISFIQVPTTLLAQVDSSVGGKTGVNHRLGKNMIGTFWQPKLVWMDLETLKTLPRRELLAGLAEVIKYGVIYDSSLFEFLESNRNRILDIEYKAIEYIIKRSCEIKADVVSKDEREAGLRAILNYGHTIGHAIETVTGYTRYLHGEAVAIGMCLEARLSQILGRTDEGTVSRIRALVDSYGLPSEMPGDIDTDRLISSMQLDKKTVGGRLKFILPEKIGAVKIETGVSGEEIRKSLEM